MTSTCGPAELMDGYRFPLRGLRPDEAEALLILGVPEVLREFGLDRALDAAHRQIAVTAGEAFPTANGGALVHLDLPRWFGGQDEVPCLRELARALRLGRTLRFRYTHHDGRGGEPLGLVNKAGIWYLVAATREPQKTADVRVFRVGLRTSPEALAVFPEVFGPAVRPALEAALAPDEDGWREVTLSFEHELAAAHRLAGFGGRVQVLSPPTVRDELLATAREILSRYEKEQRGQG